MCVVRAHVICIRKEIILMSVQECGIGTRGALHLFKALLENSTLQRLSMRGNATRSVEGAADAWSRFGARALDMSSNELEEIPLEFIEALPRDCEFEVEMEAVVVTLGRWKLNASCRSIAELRRWKKLDLSVCAKGCVWERDVEVGCERLGRGGDD